MASSQKKRCAGPSFAAVPTQLEPTTKTICVRTRSPRPSGFLSATLCSLTLRSARSSSFIIVKATPFYYFDASTPQRLFIVDLIVCLFGPFWRRRLISKFAVPNLAAGVRDIFAGSHSHSAEQNYRNNKWPGRFWPLYRGCDRNRTQNRERVENPDEILGTILMFRQPGLSIFVCH